MDLLAQLLIPLLHSFDLSMKLSLGLIHPVDPDEAPIPADGENRDQNGESRNEEKAPLARNPGCCKLPLSARDYLSRPHR
jgi:hypothetical protein